MPPSSFVELSRGRIGALAVAFLAPLLMAATPADTRWSTSVEALVADATRAHEAALRGEGPRPVAVFDFDNTLIFGDIAFAALPLLIAEGRLGFDPADPNGLLGPEVAGRFAALKVATGPARVALVAALTWDLFHRYRSLTKTRSKEAALGYLVQLFQGLTPEETRGIARDALARATGEPLCWRTLSPPAGVEGEPIRAQSGVRVRAALKEMVAALDRAGFEVWVVSASPERLVEGAAEAFGIPPERVIGVRSEEPDGRIGPKVLEPVTYRAGKRAAIEQRIGRRPALVFGDAWTDFEMLTWAERGVLVDTGDDAELRDALRPKGVVIQEPFGAKADLLPCP